MIDIEKLQLQLDKSYLPNENDKEALDYVIAVVTEDVVEIVSDIINIARDSSTTDRLYEIYVKNIIDESEDNLNDVVDLYNLYGGKQLETLKIDILPVTELPNDKWLGPVITPVFKEDEA